MIPLTLLHLPCLPKLAAGIWPWHLASHLLGAAFLVAFWDFLLATLSKTLEVSIRPLRTTSAHLTPTTHYTPPSQGERRLHLHLTVVCMGGVHVYDSGVPPSAWGIHISPIPLLAQGLGGKERTPIRQDIGFELSVKTNVTVGNVCHWNLGIERRFYIQWYILV